MTTLARQDDGELWFLYVVRCADDTLYTGITNDLERRLAEHNAGRGARYTKSRRPVTMLAAWRFDDGGRARAMQAEQHFKRLGRGRKLALVGKGDSWQGGTRVTYASTLVAETNC
jgi:putative endonuclease